MTSTRGRCLSLSILVFLSLFAEGSLAVEKNDCHNILSLPHHWKNKSGEEEEEATG